MATTSRAPTRTSLQLPRPIEPIKPLASEPCGPQTANLPSLAPTLHLFVRASRSKQRRRPQLNLHSPNSRPAVQCNEGFCNAPEGQRLTLTTSTASQKPHHYANPQGESGLASVVCVSHIATIAYFYGSFIESWMRPMFMENPRYRWFGDMDRHFRRTIADAYGPIARDGSSCTPLPSFQKDRRNRQRRV